MIDGLHGRLAHLFALAAAGRCLLFGLLAVMLPETDIHVALNVGDMVGDVADHLFLNSPPEEVELADGGLLNGRLTADLEIDAFTATEGIKETLAVGLEFALVMEVHHELARGGWITLHQGITDVELLGVVRDKPVNETEADRRRACQYGHNLLKPPRLIVEVLEPADNEVLFALDAILEGLTLTAIAVVHPCLC